MLLRSLADPFSLVVLALVGAMLVVAVLWILGARRDSDALAGGLSVLRRVGRDLPREHPIRKRLESAPIVEVSFEEIAHLLGSEGVGESARALVGLRERLAWIERFAQLSVHLGILGTVLALVTSDPTDLDAFRSRLPTALGTTFWGLVGAVGLSALAGTVESTLERAGQRVRDALLGGFDPQEPEPELEPEPEPARDSAEED